MSTGTHPVTLGDNGTHVQMYLGIDLFGDMQYYYTSAQAREEGARDLTSCILSRKVVELMSRRGLDEDE